MAYEVYEISDIKLEIDNRTKGYSDLNFWVNNVATPEDKKEIEKITKLAVIGTRIALGNQMAFHATFAMNLKTYISYEMPAPMGVNTTQKGISTYLNLYINPLWLIYTAGNKELGPFVRDDKFQDTADILYHELCHLLFEHPALFKDESQNGLHEIANYAEDTFINQLDRLKDSQFVQSSGITLEATKKIFNLPHLKPKMDSRYYFNEIYKGYKKNKNNTLSQGGDACPVCGSKMVDDQDQNGQGQSQDQNGQGQSQDQNGQGQSQDQNGQSQNQDQNGQGQNQGQNGQSQNQDQNGQGQNQDQNGQGQNQGQNGQGHGKHCPNCGHQSGNSGNQGGQGQQMSGSGQAGAQMLDDHSVWYETPSDVAADHPETRQIAGERETRCEISEAVKRTMQDPIVQENVDREKLRGLMAGGLYDEAITGKASEGKISIRTILRKGAGRLRAGISKTFVRPSRLQSNRIDIRKGKKKLWNKNIRVFLDNSGSMGTFEISWATMEIAAIARSIKANLEIIPFDTVVYDKNKQSIPKNGKFEFVPTGRGGTSFQPVFDYLKEVGASNQNDVIIVLTDGYGESEVDFYGLRNVVWVLVEETRNTLSVNPSLLKGHLVGYLEDDKKYRFDKMDHEAA